MICINGIKIRNIDIFFLYIQSALQRMDGDKRTSQRRSPSCLFQDFALGEVVVSFDPPAKCSLKSADVIIRMTQLARDLIDVESKGFSVEEL